MPEITIDDFKRLDLRIGRITAAEEISGADKLYRLTVDIGDEIRTLVAGIREHYSIDDLTGRQIIVVANLKPAKIRGIESKGMLLAADDGKILSVLAPDQDVEIGARVS